METLSQILEVPPHHVSNAILIPENYFFISHLYPRSESEQTVPKAN